MSQTRLDEVIEVALTDKDYKKKLKDLGISQDELEKYIEEIIKKPERSYHRILSAEEKRAITPDAFGYLMHLLLINSIESTTLEKVITISMQLHVFLKRKINKNMMDEIINYLIFSGQKDISIKELMDMFYLENNDYGFDEEVN
ncbi:MAG: hypothetical protein K9N09_10425 [Candidatus Cloacimonetes bacterium]|nr:hypothetical protein [Candidatus Cloacimonadota bacterium]MCF7814640.1 hypothetical protein [Candidatus Cloacimonadota bacterium]MCF7869107.1 hypothetical protein [Candidatus Cloacimonadota bacterium]MCF7884530.1 hypothetical protein [Candidatus Cloacimonadota bacterium]